MPKKKTINKKPTKDKAKATTGSSEISSSIIVKKKFPIVGLGASAGGLEALKLFFAAVPEKSGMAYIVVAHMSPKQPSMMPALLQKETRIPVVTAEDDQIIEPDHAYVIPSNKDLTVYQGKIQLLDIARHTVALSIDFFLRSLAKDQGSYSAAVILSGTGTDGTLGVKEIKANDGLVIAQSIESAGYDGMPRSVINNGLVDIILPPEEVPAKLVQYFAHTKMPFGSKPAAETTDDQQEWLHKIFAILRVQIGHDFSTYKTNTMIRRIRRRMGLNQIDGYQKYTLYLRENPAEVETLFRELLIGVTNFFRDADSFEILKASVLPELAKQMKDDDTLRVWIPGCSTGEEAYSLAIVLREFLDTIPKRINLQLFGTDIDDFAIDKAREGIFPASIQADVSEDRLKRFFQKNGDFFSVHKVIRDSVVFSVQNIIKDPPFSKLNLLCCRNLMIYLNTEAQRRLMPLFHYTLKPDGVLMLGSSETIGGFTNLFETLDRKWKIYRRQEVPKPLLQMVDFPSGLSTTLEHAQPILPVIPMTQKADITQITQKAILDQFAPTAILIDAQGVILHIQGRSGKYLEAPSGPPTFNILDLAREGLRIELSSVFRRARTSDKQVTRKNVGIKHNGSLQMINLHVCPLRSPKQLAGRFLVVFEDIRIDLKKKASDPDMQDPSHPEPSRIVELERELQITRENLQTTIEELESSNEELKSTNEELQSANEELQSTNEELESSKEELQSLNEELQTVNSELQNKLEELSAAHDDMQNLLNSTEIATIFVDNRKYIRRFTQEATAIVNLIQTDIGRPLEHVVTNLANDKMITNLDEVLQKLIQVKVEVQTTKGDWYTMRIVPYRTMDNRIDGAVISFVSIAEQKKAQAVLENAMGEIETARELVRTIFDMNPDPLMVLDERGKIVIANTVFSRIMGMTQKDLDGLDIDSFESRIPVRLDLKQKLGNALQQNQNFETDPFEIDTPEGKKRFVLQGRIINLENNRSYRLLIQFVNFQ